MTLYIYLIDLLQRVRTGFEYTSASQRNTDAGTATCISAPAADDSGGYWCYVESKYAWYRFSWHKTINVPDLRRFPQVAGCNVSRVRLSREMTRTLRNSETIDHGADSCIRLTSTTGLPILKVAHPHALARDRLRWEFEMLKHMSNCSLSVPKYDPKPLTDSTGIYAYRMQKLHRLDFENLEQYRPQVAAAISRVHAAQVSLGDLHPGNVMLDEEGNVVLIDFSYAGRLNDPVPSHIPEYIYGGSPYIHTLADEQRLETQF